MNEYLIFAITIIAISLGLITYVQWKDKKKIKKGAMEGIKLFVLFGLVVGLLFFCSESKAEELNLKVEYFAFGEVYLGLDYTTVSPSPFCEPSSGFNNGSHDRLTSNGGVRGNIIRYGAFQLNGKFTHHSGATCDDEPTYNAIGVEAVLTLW